MILETERLKLIKFNKNDFENYKSIVMNPLVMKYISTDLLSEESSFKKFKKIIEINAIEPNLGYFSIITKKLNLFIGYGKLTRISATQIEIGCCLLPEFWGNQYATELFKLILAEAKKLKVVNLLSIVNAENRVSKAIILKSDFIYSKQDCKNGITREYYEYYINN
jgi:ribosomal-protein-alanine N-acetyltransferase